MVLSLAGCSWKAARDNLEESILSGVKAQVTVAVLWLVQDHKNETMTETLFLQGLTVASIGLYRKFILPRSRRKRCGF